MTESRWIRISERKIDNTRKKNLPPDTIRGCDLDFLQAECNNKSHYKTKREAKNFIKRNKWPASDQKIYVCAFCGDYAISTEPKRQKKKRLEESIRKREEKKEKRRKMMELRRQMRIEKEKKGG